MRVCQSVGRSASWRPAVEELEDAVLRGTVALGAVEAVGAHIPHTILARATMLAPEPHIGPHIEGLREAATPRSTGTHLAKVAPEERGPPEVGLESPAPCLTRSPQPLLPEIIVLRHTVHPQLSARVVHDVHRHVLVHDPLRRGAA